MPFIDNLLQYSSLSIVGMEKNTGKTECMNYIIGRLKGIHKRIAITSIGIDGENLDQVTSTHKPEIQLYNNTVFVTSEKHYRERQLVSEILDLSERQTSLGRLVTAQVILSGKVILSGPTTNVWLKQVVDDLRDRVDLTLIDGALSRKTQASPTIAESMILTTGAALSPNLMELTRKTKFFYNLLQLPVYQHNNGKLLENIESGIFAIDSEKQPHQLDIPSTLLLNKYKDSIFTFGTTLYIAGIITDNILNFMRMQKKIRETILIVKDFSKIFVTPEAYYSYIQSGGKLLVLLKNELVAICVNPTSPNGYTLDSEKLCDTLRESIGIPVYDVIKIQNQTHS